MARACPTESLVSNGVPPYFCIKNTLLPGLHAVSFITVRQTMTIIPLIVLERVAPRTLIRPCQTRNKTIVVNFNNR